MPSSSGGVNITGMKTAAIIRARTWLPAVALVALVLGGFGLQRSPRISTGARPVFNSLAHWRGAGHDWLLVVDGKADEVVVYNAADGRPLHRMRISKGLPEAGGLVQRDGDLFVVGDDGSLDKLKLSPQWVASVEAR